MSADLKKIIFLFLIVLAIFSFFNFSVAQNSNTSSLASLNIDTLPASPRAGDGVTFTLSSNLIDLNSSKINWYVDDIIQKTSSNKTLTIKMKSDGQNTTVKAVIETVDGIIKETTKTISSSGVDLIVEPISYTLPFYKGKPLFPREGVAKIVAIPDIIINGTRMLSKDLNFKWTRGENVLGSESGKGQNSIIVTSTIPVRDISIDLQVLDDSGNVLAENSKMINLDNPSILFYEESPLYGILYNKAIVNDYYLGVREEFTVIAKPFSFDFLTDTQNNANYNWYVNGNNTDTAGKANELLLKQAGTNLKGTASVSLNVSNTNKINQYASGSFNVDFGQ